MHAISKEFKISSMLESNILLWTSWTSGFDSKSFCDPKAFNETLYIPGSLWKKIRLEINTYPPLTKIT